MAILVTGGTGYIGSAVVRELAGLGEELVLLARAGSRAEPARGVRVIPGDVTVLDDVATAMHGCSAVVHMAVTGITGGDRDAVRNVLMAASYAAIDRIVFTSSVLALDPGAAAAEDAVPATRAGGPCITGRVEALAYARDHAAQGMPIIFLYPGIPFGPGPARASSWLNRWIAAVAAGRLRATAGRRDARLCLAYTPDLARGHRLALERGVPGRGYVLVGESVTLAAWIALAAGIAGVKPPAWRIPAAAARLLARVPGGRVRWPGGMPALTADQIALLDHEGVFSSARAVGEIGYPVTPLREATAATIAWLPPLSG